MAVDPDLSHARTYSRREAEIASSPTSFGRGVGDQFHDDAVSGLVSTIKALQDGGKADAIVLYDRTGQKVGSARLEEGRWVPDKSMADELKKVHALPDQGSRDEAAKTWDSAATLMEVRNADPDDRRKVEAFRDAARALATPVPGQQADSDKLATLRVTEQPAGPRSVLSPAKVQEELDKYLPTARLEAVAVLRSAAKAGAPASEIEAARSDLNYLNHAKGPAYQARLVEQLGSRDVQAVITRNQTPLERVRELGAAIGAEIKQRDPAQAAKAMAAIDLNQLAPARPAMAPQKQSDPQQPSQERGRSR